MQGVFAFDDSAQHEAKEWLLDLKRMTDLTQFSELFSLLGKANTVAIVNQANAVLKQACSIWRSEELGIAADAVQQTQACAIKVYYRVLHNMLESEEPDMIGLSSRPSSVHTRRQLLEDVAADASLQTALLLCAVDLVTFACHPDVKLFEVGDRLYGASRCIAVWNAVGLFWEHLVEADVPPRPPASTEGGDQSLLRSFLIAANRLLRSRIEAVCAVLKQTVVAFAEIGDIEKECLLLLDAVMDPSLDLLFGQHLSNVVACCVYGIARKHNVALSFKRITSIIVSAFPHHTPEIFTEAEIGYQPGCAGNHGEVREFYNTVFLPRMQDVLRGSSGVNADKKVPAGTLARMPLRSLTANDMSARNVQGTRMGAMKKSWSNG